MRRYIIMEYYSSLAKRRQRGDTSDDLEAVSSSTASKNPQNNDDELHLGQSINNSSHTAHLRREEQLQKKMEEDEAALLLASLRTHAVADPPETHEKPFICNEARKRRSSSESINNKEMGSTPPKKKRRANKSFAQRLEDLQAYKEKHGHTNVKKSEDKSLYNFCNRMRLARSNPEKSTVLINKERMASLDALGFEWSMNRTNSGIKSFEQRIDDLRAYKEEHGHVNVKGSEDKSLNQFCSHIRYARHNPGKSNLVINDDRIASLDALGFDWSRWI